MSFAGKQVVESSRLGTTAAAAAAATVATAGGKSGADNRQYLNGVMNSIDTKAAAAMQKLVARKDTSSETVEPIDVVRRMMNNPPTERPIVLAGENVYIIIDVGKLRILC